MSNNVKTICLRLNLDKPIHRQAWEYLRNADKEQFKSYSKIIAVAVNEYFERCYRKQSDPYFETREREEKFVSEIVGAVEKAVEKSMPNFLAACLTGLAKPCLQTELPEQNSEEIPDIDMDFIGG